MLQKLGRHANTGVFDGEAKERACVVERFDGGKEGDGAAMLVVFDAVVEQVDDDSADMGGAADHALVDGIGLAGVEQRNAAVRCAESAQYQRIVAELFEVERLVLEGHLVFFDPAHLEDVID